MIKHPSEMNFSEKNFSMILYGPPGVGKTTLALSAPDPVLIDFDRGVSRVKAAHRKLTVVCADYEDVLADLHDPAVEDCKTLIIDTGGSFITFLQDWSMRKDPAKNRNKDGSFSLKGWGAVKTEFVRFNGMIRDIMNKNVIYVFHSNEEKDKDGRPMQRLQCEGAARNLVWQPCDLGGYVQMIGNKRHVSFTPEEEFFAKGCYGIEGRREIPTLLKTEKNEFLSRLIHEARANITAEAEVFATEKSEYESIMKDIVHLIDGIQSADDANDVAKSIPGMNHVLTSKSEASALLKTKTQSLNLAWSKTDRRYVPADGGGAAGDEKQAV
jgi:shikimate kinase